MTKVIFASLAVLSLLIIGGCETDRSINRDATSPLTAYLAEQGFTSFRPPRAGDGVGSIIRFDQQQESIIYPATKCFPITKVPAVANAIAALDIEYTVSSSQQLELSLPQLSKYKVDLAATVGKNGVRAINVRLIKPTVVRITRGEAKDYVRTLTNGDSCVEEIRRPGNLVIHSALTVEGVEYTFVGESSTKVALDVAILNTIKASPELAQQVKGKASIKFMPEGNDQGRSMLRGYRSWRAADVPGALTTDVELLELSAKDVETVRK